MKLHNIRIKPIKLAIVCMIETLHRWHYDNIMDDIYGKVRKENKFKYKIGTLAVKYILPYCKGWRKDMKDLTEYYCKRSVRYSSI